MDERPSPDARPYGRRAFLALTIGGVSSLFWGKSAIDALSRIGGPADSVIGAVVPSGWRIYTVAATMPRFDPTTWRLRVGGLVERPQTLTYRQLRALPRAEQVSDFHCVTGWSVDGVRWAGVRFHDLLAAAQPRPEATALQFVSAEKPYLDTLQFDQALLGDVMLAYEMNGEPIPREHGAPVRVVIPEMYGYKNVKWVERIDLVADPQPGYWEQRGYDANAWVGRSNGYG